MVTQAAACGGNSPQPPTQPQPALGISCPPAISVQSTDGRPVAIAYPGAVPAGGRAPVTTTCTPPPGSSFDIGTSSVTCEAVDGLSQRASCSFTVTVAPRPPGPVLSATKFLAFGDSITEGVTSMAPFTIAFLDYPSGLQGMLAARYYDQTISVKNAGLAGELALDGQDRLQHVFTTVRPEVVLLMEGVNDLSRYGEAGIEPAANALHWMTRYAQREGARVFLGTLLRQRPGAPKACCVALLEQFNSRVQRVAELNGAELVDLYSQVDLSLIGSDGLHPTEAGHQRIAEVFFEAIRSSLERPAPNPAR
jgi:lysophospholipase L1-like esterase